MVLRAATVRAGIALVTFLALTTAFACGTDRVGVDACRQIEYARCENANSCGISLSSPVHRGDTPSLDVGACKRFYEDQCLHGFVGTNDPGGSAVQACVDAINNATDCDIIKNPEHSPACAFLIPPDAADAAADAADTSTE